MAAKKKIKEVVTFTGEPVELKALINTISVDYPSEGLNDMARKINEIIVKLNNL